MSPDTFEATYDVHSYFVNPAKTLGLVALLNVLQDVAWRHGDLQGHGWEDSVARGAFWVMTRQLLNVEGAARLGERLTVQTWLRPADGAFVTRDFVVTVDARPLARCAMTFTLIDLATRRPRRQAIDFGEVQFKTTGTLDLAPRKLTPRADARALETFRVRNSDLDVNLHVNNTRYAQWILDAVPFAFHQRYRLDRYEICFLAEAKGGDEIAIQMIEVEGGAHLQGVRAADQRVIFAAQVGLGPGPSAC